MVAAKLSKMSKEARAEMLENLIDRRAESNRDLFKAFYLRYLTPELRVVAWRGLL